jgi:hypothetical protein
MDPTVATEIARERLKRAVEGYTYQTPKGEVVEVGGLGSGFRYCALGEALFDEGGNIREVVSFSDLAAHIFFTETGSPIPERARGNTPLLGAHNGIAVYLLFNGVLGKRRPNGGKVLTADILRSLPPHDGPKVVYGEGSRLGSARLKRAGIVFKQIPYQIAVR